MAKEETAVIKQRFATKMKNGYPLIEKSAFDQPFIDSLQEGTLLQLLDEKGSFLGKGYFGRQNKGVGWVLTRKQGEKIDRHFFQSRLKAAFDKRTALQADDRTTVFRLFNGEGDGIGGLTIDYYDRFYLCTWYSEGIYTFRKEIYEALQAIVSCKGIYEKKRFSAKGQYVEDDDFVSGERGEFPLLVKENGMTFAVYLNDGPMTGIFLDQRDVRRRIRDHYAAGKDVLNTFSYTGAFSVAAALGGARKTTSVDLAKRSLPKTIEQFSINQLDYEAQDIVVMDVFQYFSYARKKGKTFDLVVLDPPSFARSKKRTFSAQKDYTGLLQEAIALTRRNGVIVASTNCSLFSMKKFHSFIREAFSREGVNYELIEQYSLPADFRTMKAFPEGDYLKVVFLKRLS
ncbi:class I SAM-dependent rRNA methyltransferase [Alkalihalobacillus oceani]|uniref:class I SAM-dependent rRNA methyltransferase n=1 Tax=Halalkalibacter oceani TaxID=1653776 RepID=UPI00203F7A89|nr:class I SAM-dependent rRNA methyltransferase [Halalkalibacter oceani]MCM3759974.1 class I SAM-dependent rRNA methyltransferase [Halalkalibacter oceani]